MWAAGRSLFRRRIFYLSGQPANIIKNTLPCSIIRNVDFLQRFSSVNFSDDPISSSTKLEDDVDRKLKYIKLEMTNLRDEGYRVPELSYVKPQHWGELLKLESKSARMSYYSFLFISEKRRESDNLKKQERTRAYSAFKEQQGKEENSHNNYSLSKAMMLRIHERTMDIWRNNRLRRAMQFGEEIVFDCSYDPFMTRREAKDAAKQLTTCFAENRRHKDPFDLHFCNVDFNGNTFARLESEIPNVRNKAFPLNLYEGSYLDLFPKEKLVYLTPHCQNDLTEYDPDSIYIIGAMVDKCNPEPLSLMKAKELNLKVARLPLDRYLEWNGSSRKTLALDQMMKIMLTLKTSRSWDCALKHVPRRKIVNEESNQQKRVTKWTVSVNKFKESFRTGYNLNLRGGSERDTLPTAEKFKRKIGTDDKFARNAESSFNFNSLVSTADKLKKPENRNSHKDKNTKTLMIDVKTLLNK